MENQESESAEERRKKAREHSRVTEIVSVNSQLAESSAQSKAETDEDNELFVAQGPAPKRSRRIPILTNREIRQSISVGLNQTGSKSAATATSSLTHSSQSVSSSRRKAKSKANEVDLDTLFGSDIIRDGQLNALSDSVPIFTHGNKDRALSELIASIPTASQGEARPDKQAVIEATKQFTRKAKSDKRGGWKHPFLKTSLYHHQILGAAFMRVREKSAIRPHGGMLCDVMGLGKTIQTLANIVDGELTDLEDGAKTTLIVVPRSVLEHWKQQIEKHVEPNVLRVLYYYPGHKPDTNDIVDTILRYNVVITSYEEIRRSYPKLTTSTEEYGAAPSSIEKEYMDKAGPLHQIRFRRIIIDEGHFIRNPASQGSVAVRALHGHFKWVLTGTPLLNHTGELWAYFNFLDVPNIGQYNSFISNYCSDKDAALKRLVNVVRAVIFRRTYASRLFTLPIIVLPDLGERTVSLKALRTEKMIYQMIQEIYIKNINSMAPSGDQPGQNRCFLTMLLKLRMCNSHPLLVQDMLKDLLDDDENVAKIHNLVPENADETDPDRIIVGVLQKLKTADETLNTGQLTPIGPLNIEFRGFLMRLRNMDNDEEFYARTQCIFCGGPPNHPEVTPCMHLICKECLMALKQPLPDEGGSSLMCPGGCGVAVQNEEPLKLNPSILTYQLGFNNSASIASNSGLTQQTYLKPRRKVSVLRTANGMDVVHQKEVDWVKTAGRDMPSSKVTAVRKTIQEWLAEDADVKIVIFTQFCDMVHIFWQMCEQEGWDCVKLTGDMSFPSRQGSISDFGTKKEIKLMIASLRVGGVGIDLTMANKCILVEPWWNDAVQQQAFCRLFRIGQVRQVEIVKIVVEDTIDAYMLGLQGVKNRNIEEAIGEKAITGRSSVEEIMESFGKVERVETGAILIHPHKQ